MILPILEYGDILYNGCNQNLLSKIQTLQNRCLHLCNFEPYHVPVIYLHQISGIARLDLRRRMHLILYMFKQRTNMSKVNIRVTYTRTHDALLFNTERPLSEKKKNLFKGAMLWNLLTVPIHNIESYNCMNKCLAFKQTVPLIIV